MFDVVIRYKQDTDTEKWREIMRIAADYDYMRVGLGGDFCLLMGDKGLDGFCEKIRNLDYVEKVELRKY